VYFSLRGVPLLVNPGNTIFGFLARRKLIICWSIFSFRFAIYRSLLVLIKSPRKSIYVNFFMHIFFDLVACGLRIAIL
jgi:hypothetical protein